MSDLVKGIGQGKYALPSPVMEAVLHYWDSCGRRLNDYRDLGQHHALVASDGRILLSDTGEVLIYLLLPSNPEAKAAGKLIFGAPNVHALQYMEVQLGRLFQFLSWLTRGLLLPESQQERKVVMYHFLRDPAKFGSDVFIEGYPIPDQSAMEHHCRGQIDRVRKLHAEGA